MAGVHGITLATNAGAYDFEENARLDTTLTIGQQTGTVKWYYYSYTSPTVTFPPPNDPDVGGGFARLGYTNTYTYRGFDNSTVNQSDYDGTSFYNDPDDNYDGWYVYNGTSTYGSMSDTTFANRSNSGLTETIAYLFMQDRGAVEDLYLGLQDDDSHNLYSFESLEINNKIFSRAKATTAIYGGQRYWRWANVSQFIPSSGNITVKIR